MRRWFSSDLHLGHANVIGFCGRPHTDVGHMNTDLLARLNAHAHAGDELWLLGDHAMGDIARTLPMLGAVSAELHLVMGNHDRCHPYRGSRHREHLEQYTELTGAASVTLLHTRMRLTDGNDVTVSHFPWRGQDVRPWTDRAGRLVTADKFADYRALDDGGWLLCGHVHEKWRQQGRMINVGIDAWGGRPVSEDEIVALIAAGPRDLTALPWS